MRTVEDIVRTVDDWTGTWCLVDLSPGQSVNCSLPPGRAAQSSLAGRRGGGRYPVQNTPN